MGRYERSPLKQPGVPNKETAAEHARRIAKTRAQYANMSRRGGALQGRLRTSSRDGHGFGAVPVKQTTTRCEPRNDTTPPKTRVSSQAWKRSSDTCDNDQPKEVRDALAYAHGDEASTSGSDSDSESDSNETTRVIKKTHIRLPTLAATDDAPITPSRAWFTRKTRSTSDRFAADIAKLREGRERKEAEEGTKRVDSATLAAAASAKLAKASAEDAADKMEAFAARMAERARAPCSDEDEEDDHLGTSSEEVLFDNDVRPTSSHQIRNVPPPSRPASSAPSLLPPPPTPREAVPSSFDGFLGLGNTGSSQARQIGQAGVSATHALHAARAALNAAAAANAELRDAAKRTPFRGKTKTSPPERKPSPRLDNTPPGISTRSESRLHSAVSPKKESDTTESLPDKKYKNMEPVSFDFSKSLRRAIDDGRERHLQVLETYNTIASRCRAISKVHTRVTVHRLLESKQNPEDDDARETSDEDEKPSSQTKTKSKKLSPFRVPSRDDTLQLIRDMEDRARRKYAEQALEEEEFADRGAAANKTVFSTSSPPRGLQKLATHSSIGDTSNGLPASFRPFGPQPGTSMHTYHSQSHQEEVQHESSDSDDSAGLTPELHSRANNLYGHLVADDSEHFSLDDVWAKSAGHRKQPTRPHQVHDFESLVAYAFQ